MKSLKLSILAFSLGVASPILGSSAQPLIATLPPANQPVNFQAGLSSGKPDILSTELTIHCVRSTGFLRVIAVALP